MECSQIVKEFILKTPSNALLLTGLIGLFVSGGAIHAQPSTEKNQSSQKSESVKAEARAAEKGAQQSPPTAASIDAKTVSAVRVLIQSERETVLSSQMQGKVKMVNAQLGSRFSAGTVLVALDCDEHEARLRSSDAELIAAEANFKAKKGLFELSSASELEVVEAEAAKNRAAAQVDLHRTQVRYCLVRAPFSGMAAKIRVKPHENVTVNQPLIDIVDQSKLKAQLHVPSNALPYMSSDAVFKIRVDETGQVYDARLNRTNSRVDAASQTIEIEATILTPSVKLTSGMSGTADLTPLVLAEERRREAALKAKADKEAKAKAAAEAKAQRKAEAKREAEVKAKREAAEKDKAKIDSSDKAKG